MYSLVSRASLRRFSVCDDLVNCALNCGLRARLLRIIGTLPAAAQARGIPRVQNGRSTPSLRPASSGTTALPAETTRYWAEPPAALHIPLLLAPGRQRPQPNYFLPTCATNIPFQAAKLRLSVVRPCLISMRVQAVPSLAINSVIAGTSGFSKTCCGFFSTFLERTLIPASRTFNRVQSTRKPTRRLAAHR